jgi:hypothetical protein
VCCGCLLPYLAYYQLPVFETTETSQYRAPAV